MTGKHGCRSGDKVRQPDFNRQRSIVGHTYVIQCAAVQAFEKKQAVLLVFLDGEKLDDMRISLQRQKCVAFLRGDSLSVEIASIVWCLDHQLAAQYGVGCMIEEPIAAVGKRSLHPDVINDRMGGNGQEVEACAALATKTH